MSQDVGYFVPNGHRCDQKGGYSFMSTKAKRASLFAFMLVDIAFSNQAFAVDLRIEKPSKEDIKAAASPNFIVSRDLSDVLSSQLKGLAVTITSRQNGTNLKTRDTVASYNQMSQKAWMRKLSTLSFDPDSQKFGGDEDKMRTIMSSQSRKAAEVNFKNSVPLITKFQKGLNFNLDLKGSSTSSKASSSVPEIKYGLVESDIIPGEHQIPIASLGRMDEFDAPFSTPAKVVYTIDKLDGSQSTTVFNTPADTESYTEIQSTSMWKRIPSHQVKIKIDAADQNNAVTDQVNSNAAPTAPAMRVTMTQADGFVSTQVTTGKDSKKSMITELRAPLYGEMSLARKYDYKHKPTETVAQNILGSRHRPLVNIAYVHKTQTSKAEVVVRHKRSEYKVIAEPRNGWSPSGDRSMGKVGDKITLAVVSSF
jgi:hypothetical protein